MRVLFVGLLSVSCAGPRSAVELAPESVTPPSVTPPSSATPSVERSATAGRAQTAAGALDAWRSGIDADDHAALVALVHGPILLKARMVPGRPAEDTVDGRDLWALLEDGEARRLGLHRHHMLPAASDLTIVGDRARAVDERCPSVIWIFVREAAGWRMSEVHFEPLEC